MSSISRQEAPTPRSVAAAAASAVPAAMSSGVARAGTRKAAQSVCTSLKSSRAAGGAREPGSAESARRAMGARQRESTAAKAGWERKTAAFRESSSWSTCRPVGMGRLARLSQWVGRPSSSRQRSWA